VSEAERQFEHGGRCWIARLAGHGGLGTGVLGLGAIDAVHFLDAAAPDRPLREALIARGRFPLLFDAELRQLCDAARPIRPAGER
jgi:hypothetical protein